MRSKIATASISIHGFATPTPIRSRPMFLPAKMADVFYEGRWAGKGLEKCRCSRWAMPPERLALLGAAKS